MEEERIKEEPSVIQISQELLQNVSGHSDLSRVTTLNLSLRAWKIRRIENLQGLSNLRELNLSYNLISNIENLEQCYNLVDINLAENKITTIENLSLVISLEDLNLSGNKIREIPKSEFETLQNLKILQLARNQISNIGEFENLSVLSGLHALYINGNPAAEHPDCTEFINFYLKSLQFLDGFAVSKASRSAVATPEEPVFKVEDDTKQIMHSYETNKTKLLNEIRGLEVTNAQIQDEIVANKLLLETLQEKQKKEFDKLESQKNAYRVAAEESEEVKKNLEISKRKRESEEIYVDNMLEEIDSLKEQKAQMLEEAAKREESYSGLNQKLSDLEADSKQRMVANEKKISSARELLKQAEVEIVNIQGKIREKKQVLADLDAEILKSDYIRDRGNSYLTEEAFLKDQLVEKQNTFERIQSKISEREKYLELMENNLHNVKIELSKAQCENQNQSSQKEVLSDKLDDLQGQIIECRAKKTELENFLVEFSKIESKAVQKTTMLERVNQDIASKQATLANVKGDFKELQKVIREYNEKIAGIEREIEQEASAHEQAIFEANTAQHSKKLEIERILDEIDNANQQLGELCDNIDEKDKTLNDLCTQIAARQDMLTSRHTELEEVNCELMDKHETLSNLQTEITEMEENLYGKKEVLNKVISELADLERGISSKANALEELDNEIDTKTIEFENEKDRYAELQDQLETVDAQLETNYAEFQKEQKTFDERLETLEIKKCETEASLTQIRVDVEKTHDEIQRVEDESTTIEAQLLEADSIAEEKQIMIKNTEDQLAQATQRADLKRQELETIRNEIKSYEDNLKNQKDALNKVIEDLNEIEQTITSKSGILEKTNVEIDNATISLQNFDRDIAQRGDDIKTTEVKISEFQAIFEKEREIFEQKLLGMVQKTQAQKQHIKKQKTLLGNIANERQDTVREIETLTVKMGSKEAAHHSTLDKIAAAGLNAKKQLRILQEQVSNERETLIALQSKTTEGLKKLEPTKQHLDTLQENIKTSERQGEEMRNRIVELQQKEDSIYILLALSGHRLDETVQQRVTEIVNCKTVLEDKKAALAETRAEIQALREHFHRPAENFRYQQTSPAKSEAPFATSRRIDFENAELQKQLEQVCRENDLLKNEIDTKAQVHSHNFKTLEENQRMLDQKMQHLMASLDSDAIKMELEYHGFDTARSNSDLARIQPEVDEAAKLLQRLEKSYKRISLPLATPLAPIEETDNLVFENS